VGMYVARHSHHRKSDRSISKYLVCALYQLGAQNFGRGIFTGHATEYKYDNLKGDQFGLATGPYQCQCGRISWENTVRFPYRHLEDGCLPRKVRRWSGRRENSA